MPQKRKKARKDPRKKKKGAEQQKSPLAPPLQDTSNDTIFPCAPLKDGAKTAVLVEKQQKHGATRKDLPIPRKIGGKKQAEGAKAPKRLSWSPFRRLLLPQKARSADKCARNTLFHVKQIEKSR